MCARGVPIGCGSVKASALVAEGIRILKASPAIDHWQKDRERSEDTRLNSSH